MDRGSVIRVWLPLAGGLYVIYWLFATAPGPRDGSRWAGVILSILGLAGVILGRYTLGRSFSVAAKATELVTTGIYSRIRNPIYVSGLLFIGGFILISRRPALWLLIAVIVPVQIVRARREARVLEAKFGDAYRRYRDGTWF